MTKTLVAYFSASGTTERVARDLAAATDADLFRIEPEVAYTRADLNWQDKRSRSSVEMSDETARPAIASAVENMGAYDTVFVGFPVWWYVEPRIIDTFLESYDFAGKTLVPFATSGGSGLGRAPQRMQSLSPGATVVAGGTLNGRRSRTELVHWSEKMTKGA
jgi:flavodoxin